MVEMKCKAQRKKMLFLISKHMYQSAGNISLFLGVFVKCRNQNPSNRNIVGAETRFEWYNKFDKEEGDE
jgi:hypothetical protein